MRTQPTGAAGQQLQETSISTPAAAACNGGSLRIDQTGAAGA
ncbi:hypothetical protein [Steroidobacter agaridevorans]|nr:hypothetical protein [Steroidobacter agaridevorans]